MNFKLGENGILWDITGHAKDAIVEHASDMTHDIIFGILDGLRDVVVDLIGSVTLIGGGLLILAKVAGFERGYKWTGILILIDILVKYLLL